MARKLLETLPGTAASVSGELEKGLVQLEFYLSPHMPERDHQGKDWREEAMGPQVLIAGAGGSQKDCSLGICASLCLLWAPPLLFPGQTVQPITCSYGKGLSH